MKALIILAALLSTQAFADTAYMKLGDIKGESQDKAAEVIENAEESAEEVKDSAAPSNNPLHEDKNLEGRNPMYDRGVHQPGGSATGQSRRRGDVKMEDVQIMRELDKSSTKAPADGGDYNSSRSNKRGVRDAASGLPTGKRQHKKADALDEDSDNDSVDTEDTE